jgi:hypothetical protein
MVIVGIIARVTSNFEKDWTVLLGNRGAMQIGFN